ncbi:NB-ARC domain-containing protein [Nostoc sp. CCY0012]|uniref:NB-ARC domain-containing protein n=1 Tax=Nostoc sp. CCY0012 TaxID=1056123 RepID=UPI0039C5DD66
MSIEKVLRIEKVIKILESRVFQRTGRYLTTPEKVIIEGIWDDKDYKKISAENGYNVYYLSQKIAPPLWNMLSEVIGEGEKVKKISLKPLLLKLAKNDYFAQESSRLNNDALVGKTKVNGQMPDIAGFHGRQDELGYLKKQITLSKEQCIVLTGVGGIGKSFLAAKLIEEILFDTSSNVYDYFIWKTVNHCSSIDDLIDELNRIFNVETNGENFQSKIFLLSEQLRLHSCLLVIDGFERLALSDSFEKRLEYEKLFIKLAEQKSSSCTIVTSQLPLKEIAFVTTKIPIRSFKLKGLEVSAAMQILYKKGLSGEECKRLVENYYGNPSALEVVADRINCFFGGSVKKFLEHDTTIIDSRLQFMLHQQFGQAGVLTNLQRQIMISLAEGMSQKSISISFSELIDALKARLGFDLSVSQVITAIEILEQRGLIEVSRSSNKLEADYSLQSSVKKYILIDSFGLVHKTPEKIQTKEVSPWVTV